MLLLSLCLQVNALANVAQNKAPVFKIFELELLPGAIISFDQLNQVKVMNSISKENGVLTMYSLKSRTNPHNSYLIELYASDQSYQNYLKTFEYQLFSHNLEVLVKHKQVVIEVEPVFLFDKMFMQTSKNKILLVKVEVRKGEINHYRHQLLELLKKTQDQEKQVLAVYAGYSKNKENTWYLLEVFNNEEAYNNYVNGEFFQTYLRNTKTCIIERTIIDVTPTFLMSQGVSNYKVNN
ncbi:putative quinol monooxygenase [Psittacicella gerlachiana]|uniref:ABM domain-containing protein n=1 Tax=Psittacicella gerlachiana TaxID=2028574 RepID=A0A3A1YMU3_9GAMM|nr:antibiotic biosynthesis monooxygenase [Psittacicella gerlachiana]RIY38559.1 hypothetical protein CKF59_00625 [Psittacicella gerlachiana]